MTDTSGIILFFTAITVLRSLNETMFSTTRLLMFNTKEEAVI
jgi:hypothetical protein